jgi:hypothetical protein
VRVHAALLQHKFKYQQRATHNFLLLLLLLNSSRSKELDCGIYFHQKTGRSTFFHHAIWYAKRLSPSSNGSCPVESGARWCLSQPVDSSLIISSTDYLKHQHRDRQPKDEKKRPIRHIHQPQK